MGNLREIFKSMGLIAGNNLLITAINYAIFAVIISSITTYDLGIYGLAVSGLSLATFFIDMGLSKVIVSDVSKDLSEKNVKRAAGLFKGYAYTQILVATILFIIVFFSSGLIADFFKKNISAIIQLVSILIFTSGIKLLYQTSFETVADFKKVVAFQTVDSVSKLVLLLVLFSFVGKSVELIFLAMILSDIFTIAARATKIPEEIKALLREKNTDKSLIIQTLKGHGKWALLNSQIKNVEANVPIWIVEHVLGVKWAGVYFAITKFYSILAKFFEPLDTVFYPLVAKLGGLKNSETIIIRATKYVFYFSIPFILFMVLFGADLAMKIIPDKNIQEGANALKIFTLIIFIIILNMPYKPIIFNLKQQKDMSIALISVLIISIISGYYLTIYFHIIGIAISRLISALIDSLLKILIIKKSIKKFSITNLLLPDKADFDLLNKLFYKILKMQNNNK